MRMRLTGEQIIRCAVVGTLPLLVLSRLPSSCQLCYFVLGAGLLLCFRHYLTQCLGIAMCGFIWGVICAQWVLSPLQWISDTEVQVVGRIKSVAFASQEREQMVIFQVNRMASSLIIKPFELRLFWDSQQYPFNEGERWQLRVKFKAVHSRLNLAGFDTQRQAVSQHRVLQGKVVHYQRVSSHSSWRQYLITKTWQILPETESRALIMALAFGERGLLSSQQTALLRSTGLSHLLAISGLHITLAAVLGWGVGRGIQYSLPLAWIRPVFPLILSGAIAWGYTWLSGLHPPALRAAGALTLYAIGRYQGRCTTPKQSLLNIASLLVLWDPLILLTESFWLSVLAVGGLLFWYWLLPLPRRYIGLKRFYWLRLLHLQLGITLCLMPIQLLIFHGISGSALLANILAVPLISLLVVPLILIGLFFVMWGDTVYAFRLAAWLLTELQRGMSQLPLWLEGSSDGMLMVIAVWVILLSLCFTTRKWSEFYTIGIFLLGSLGSYWLYAGRSHGAWRLYMMDVGHGLAVLIEQQGKGILYDTGNRWDSGDMATLEILPFLRWQGIKLEGVIISHSHSDHSGGRDTILKAFPNVWIRSPDPQDAPCYSGTIWQWQQLTFSVLWPPTPVILPQNNDSCVVKITSEQGSILLTGDIEYKAEAELVRRWRDQLQVDFLQVPHHGSASSSSELFLRTTAPKEALSSSARYTPWSFPASKILQRYAQHRISWHDTAHSGQLRVVFSAQGGQVSSFRKQLKPRWYHSWFGEGAENE